MGEGERLRAARIAQGRTAVSVAQALCISAQYYHDLEHGRRHAPGALYARWCDVLGVECDRPDAEVLRLRPRIEALEAALRAVVADDFNAWGLHWTESYYACNWCQARGVAPDDEPREADHKDSCPWLAARRLVAEREA
jgi:transcriptional regulator with XRE-family HTH domain